MYIYIYIYIHTRTHTKSGSPWRKSQTLTFVYFILFLTIQSHWNWFCPWFSALNEESF